jgi:hypothetical protein
MALRVVLKVTGVISRVHPASNGDASVQFLAVETGGKGGAA